VLILQFFFRIYSEGSFFCEKIFIRQVKKTGRHTGYKKIKEWKLGSKYSWSSLIRNT